MCHLSRQKTLCRCDIKIPRGEESPGHLGESEAGAVSSECGPGGSGLAAAVTLQTGADPLVGKGFRSRGNQAPTGAGKVGNGFSPDPPQGTSRPTPRFSPSESSFGLPASRKTGDKCLHGDSLR